MKRNVRASRRRLAVEPLEARSLLSASASDEVFVRFGATDPASERAAELASVDGSIVTAYPDGPDLISLGGGVTPSAAIARLEAEPFVTYATPNSTIHIASTPFYPDDPDISQDWGLNQFNNIDIDAPEAYGVTLGSPSIIVAVLDSGVDLNDPDLNTKLWTNPVNDAAEGYPNDIHGWNFVSDDNDVQDDNGHGTHVTAIIAAQGNNGYGISGVAPGVQIMPLKFLDENGNGSTSDAVSAIYYAVQHGARVINASWGGVEAYGPLADAIQYANANNVVFVTAAGNTGTDNDTVPSYPASYELPNELSVAAIDQNGNLASFSDYGPATVNLAAPGVNIVSEVPTSIVPSGLESLSGTSMSAAYVSGVAALVASVEPTFTAAQIVQRIDSTVKILPTLEGKTISGGMVDAYNAVTGDTPTVWSPPVPVAGIPALIPGYETQAEVQAVVLASDEFFAVHGASAVGFVTGLYESIFGRAPDTTGLVNEVTLYNSDVATRYQIALSLLSLPEAKQTEVARWYQVDLERTTPLPLLKLDFGVDYWASLLSEGVGDNAVRAAIMSSPEFYSLHGGTPVSVVGAYYVDLTGRYADAAEVTGWSDVLLAGEQPPNVAYAFLGEFEVSETLVALWFLQDLGRDETLAQLKADPSVESLAADLGTV
jgi:thermitase